MSARKFAFNHQEDEDNTPQERDLAAWMILRSCPSQYEVLTEILGIPDPTLPAPASA
jgi:hypothetical protein